MPHYASGKPAKVGDLAKTAKAGNQFTGIITAILPAATSCNAQLMTVAQKPEGSDTWMARFFTYDQCISLSEYEKVE